MSEKQQVFEMVINTCFGGYGLSLEAAKAIAERKGLQLIVEGQGSTSSYWIKGREFETFDEMFGRFDRDLIQVVKDLGPRANGSSADLKVVNVEVHIDIENRSGKEKVIIHGYAR